jgi:hypothetical protein
VQIRLRQFLAHRLETAIAGLSRIDKDAKEKRNERIFDLWMACYTQAEIADAVNVTQPVVADFIGNGNPAETYKTSAAALHQSDFEPFPRRSAPLVMLSANA